MTETEWLASDDADTMLDLVCGKATSRRLRLFAVACCHSVGHLLTDPVCWQALKSAEQYADGLASEEEMEHAESVAWIAGKPLRPNWWAVGMVWEAVQEQIPQAAAWATWAQWAASQEEAPRLAAGLLRDIFGNPFRASPAPNASWLAWNNGAVVKLAKEMYEANAFERMPVLGELLEQAGCREEEMLSHCRGPGPHVKGCYVVDLLLGKE